MVSKLDLPPQGPEKLGNHHSTASINWQPSQNPLPDRPAAGAEETASTAPPAHPSKFPRALTAQATLSAANGQHHKAIALLEQALKQMTSPPDTADLIEETASTYQKLGDYYHIIGRGYAAYQAYETALALFDRINENGPCVVSCLKALAGLHSETRKRNANTPLYAAASYLRKAIQIERQLSGDNGTCLIDTYEQLGDALKHDDKSAAQAAYEEALRLRKLHNMYPDERTVHLLKKLGDTTMLLAPSKAISLYKEALSIEETLIEPNDPRLARFLDHLANLCSFNGQFDAAIEFRKRSIAIEELDKRSTPSQIAKRYLRLGDDLRLHGLSREAKGVILQALSIWEKSADAGTMEMANATLALSQIAEAEHDWATALSYNQKERQFLERLHGEDSRLIANIRTSARLHEAAGAIALSAQAHELAIYRAQSASISERLMLAILNQAADFYTRHDHFEKAKKLYARMNQLTPAARGTL